MSTLGDSGVGGVPEQKNELKVFSCSICPNATALNVHEAANFSLKNMCALLIRYFSHPPAMYLVRH